MVKHYNSLNKNNGDNNKIRFLSIVDGIDFKVCYLPKNDYEFNDDENTYFPHFVGEDGHWIKINNVGSKCFVRCLSSNNSKSLCCKKMGDSTERIITLVVYKDKIFYFTMSEKLFEIIGNSIEEPLNYFQIKRKNRIYDIEQLEDSILGEPYLEDYLNRADEIWEKLPSLVSKQLNEEEMEECLNKYN